MSSTFLSCVIPRLSAPCLDQFIGSHKGCSYKSIQMIVAARLAPADTQRATARVAATKNPIRKHVPCSCRACPCLDQLIGNHKGCSYKSIQMIVAAGLVPALISLWATTRR
ncbi:MAG: hypothetical protein ABIJ30_12105 [bacterium]